MIPNSPSRWTILSLAALGLVAVLAAPGGLAAAPGASQMTDPQARTVSDLRNVGTAMFVWFQDQLKARQVHRPEHGPDPDSPPPVDVTAVPVISAADLAALLVPKYILAIPAADGWGNPYEFRLNTQDLTAASMMGVRSAGSDGAFSGTTYEIQGFTATDTAQDLVWMDGYFARWPARDQAKH